MYLLRKITGMKGTRLAMAMWTRRSRRTTPTTTSTNRYGITSQYQATSKGMGHTVHPRSIADDSKPLSFTSFPFLRNTKSTPKHNPHLRTPKGVCPGTRDANHQEARIPKHSNHALHNLKDDAVQHIQTHTIKQAGLCMKKHKNKEHSGRQDVQSLPRPPSLRIRANSKFEMLKQLSWITHTISRRSQGAKFLRSPKHSPGSIKMEISAIPHTIRALRPHKLPHRLPHLSS